MKTQEGWAHEGALICYILVMIAARVHGEKPGIVV